MSLLFTHTRTWSSCSQAKYRLRSEIPNPKKPNNIVNDVLRSKDHGFSVFVAIGLL